MVTIALSPSSAPDCSWLSREEFAILEAFCDTLLPALEPPVGSSDAVAAYYRRHAGDLHVAQHIADKLEQQGPELQANIHRFLSLFAAPPVSLLLAGEAKPFIALSQTKRERYLLALANSPVGIFRQGYQGLKRLAGLIYFAAPDETGSNPNWSVMDYTPAKPERMSAPTPITPLSVSHDTVLDADVVVIGSGAGGGVVAGELARAGKNVVVLEMGNYHHEGNFTLQEIEAMSELFLNKGALATKDLGVVMMAGSALGGGTVVNWMTSFRTPDDVLAQWAQSSGLQECFTGAQLQQSFSAVEQRIGVNSANSQPNRQNQALLDGAAALGYQHGFVQRNAIGCEQRCGACNFGCSHGCSQSTTRTYLQDAFDHGARLLVGCTAQRVLIENGQVTGVIASVFHPETAKTSAVTVHAGSVVVAAGAIGTPALLLRSGLENAHIGEHLHLHPTAISVGSYAEKVYAWQGVLQSAYSDHFKHIDGNYGYTLEVAPTHPGLFGLATPWYSARSYRDEMRHIAHLASIIVLTRDKGEGAVTLNRSGEPVINYKVGAADRKNILHGLRQASRIHLAAGAHRVISLQNKPTDLTRGADDAALNQELRAFDRRIQKHGLGPNQVLIFSAHQMGSCRMGKDPAHSVVDEHQQVHGVKGLFICDASVFPSACGVNPMISIMGLAHKASQFIKTQA